jgi:AraC family transcriptional regulator
MNEMPREGSCTTGKQPSIAAAGPFIVSRTEHASHTTLSPHSHPHATITIVLGGGYHETIGGVTHQLPSMSVVVKPADILHANRVDGRGARCLLLELTADGAESLNTVTNVFDTPRVAPLVRGAELALRTLVVLERGDNEAARLALESLTMELTALIAGETSAISAKEPAARLERVRDRLEESGTGASLGDLAKEAGCHPIHLARMFRKAYGESIGSYARRVRLTRAARAIASTDRETLSRIAMRTGYYDHSHLAHEFQKRTGLAPAEWRSLAAAS